MTNILLRNTELTTNAAKRIRKMLAANNYTLVETNEDADLILEIHLGSENSTYGIDETNGILDSKVTHNVLHTSIEGNLNAANLVTGIQNIGGNLELKTGNIDQVVKRENEQRQQLQKHLSALLIQFHDVVQSLPREDADALTEIATKAEQEIGKTQPSRKMLEIKANDLLEAAKGVASITPLVLTIAQQIVSILLRYMPH